MKIALSLDILKEILDDGVKEMKSRLNFTSRQKSMLRKVLEVINKYKNLLAEDFLPVLVSDFGNSVEVKFNGHRLEPEEVQKLMQFVDMVKKSDLQRYRKILLDGIKESLEGEDIVTSVSQVLSEGHIWIMQRIELYIKREILDTVHRLTLERCELESAIFNFTEKELPDYIKKVFKSGEDAVPGFRLTRHEVKERVNETLLEYLERFRSRQKQGPIKASSVLDWLEKALAEQTNSESKDFYEKIQEGYGGMMTELDLVYKKNDYDSEEEVKKKLKVDGCVIVPCDKRMGMSLFTLEKMREADTSLMEQLGAAHVTGSKEEVLENVYGKIKMFEDSLDNIQKEYLDVVYKDRDVRRIRKQIIFPFLRSTHKVHKMTKDEISRKDLSKLKFRPVVDARRWVTRGYSTLIMGMMRKAIQDLLLQAGPILRDLKVKNGFLMLTFLQTYKRPTQISQQR